MIADFKPNAAYKESGLLWLDSFAMNEEISADILALEKEAEALLGEIIGDGRA